MARGTCVDEPAMLAALKDGTIGGAGLDCYINEPTDPRPFADIENVALTPHFSSGTPDTRRAIGEHAIKNLLAHFAGQPLLTPIPEIPN